MEFGYGKMKDLNITYIIAGLIFGYIMYTITEKLLISILLGLGVALGGNRGCIFKSKIESNQP